jgi:hypothetical protein
MTLFYDLLKLAVVCGIALACLCGCAAAPVSSDPIPSINAAGTSVDKAGAYVDAADTCVKQVQPSVPKEGQGLMDAAGTFHQKAKGSLAEAKGELAAAQSEKDTLIKEAQDAQASADKLNASWGHKLQVWVTRLFWGLVLLVAAHVVLVALGLFLPPPYATIAGILGKVINPVGWIVWLAGSFEKKQAVSAAVAAALAPPRVISDGVKTA